MAKGKVIVIEGLDGSGKGTQHKLLIKALEELGHIIVTKDFPNYATPSGQVVRQYLNGELSLNPHDVTYKQAATLYAVDRLMTYNIELREKHEDGAHLILDRYSSSNLLYQGAKVDAEEWIPVSYATKMPGGNRKLAIEWMLNFEHNDLGLPYPDQVIYLDIPGIITKELLQLRYQGDETKKDIHERDLNFQNEARRTGLMCAKQYGWHVVHCAQQGYEEKIQTMIFRSEEDFESVIRSKKDIHHEVLEQAVKVLRR